MREYDRFPEGRCELEHVNGSAQAAAEDPERADHHHETIQKLATFIKANKGARRL